MKNDSHMPDIRACDAGSQHGGRNPHAMRRMGHLSAMGAMPACSELPNNYNKW